MILRFEEVVNKYYDKLNENDLYIVKTICAERAACLNLSINALAQRCNVSRTTILRFAQKLGFSGYAEFKVFLSWDVPLQEVENGNIVESLYQDIETLQKNMETGTLEQICALLHGAERVFIYGTGTVQQEVAKELQRTFTTIHKYLHVIEGETELNNVLVDMTAADVVVIISYSGSKAFLKDIVHRLQMKQVAYISLTNLSNNFLAQNTRYNLYIPSTPFNLPNGGVFNSTVLLFLVVDLLFRCYVQKFASGESR
jgi:RpiR family glv operon transcriptional regulator